MTDEATTTGNAATPPAAGVHRLIDMVVEEVSLVDRAANLRRFLVVKRDAPMENDTAVEPGTADDPIEVDAEREGADDAEEAVDDDTPLGVAVEALENLTDMVELLSALGGDTTDPRLTTLAQGLRGAAEDLLSRLGSEEAEDDARERPDPESVQARAKGDTTPSSPPATAALGGSGGSAPPAPPPARASATAMSPEETSDSVAAAKAAITRAARRPKKKPVPPRKKPDEAKPPTDPPVPAPEDGTAKALAAISASLQALTDMVKSQHQRIGRVEKQFGLPNSTPTEEPPVQPAAEEIGWPLDLNHPLDRESVDKTISFHDL